MPNIRLDFLNSVKLEKAKAFIVLVIYFRLQKLCALDNEIVFIPSSLLQIPSLRKLHLASNKITSLCGDPNEIDDVTSTSDSESWSCTALNVLNLSHNKLKRLPQGIQGCASLIKLYLDHNSLKEFPMPWKSPLVSLISATHLLLFYN